MPKTLLLHKYDKAKTKKAHQFGKPFKYQFIGKLLLSN